MFEPKIIGFLCTWCSYTGADTAGISRLKYPANLRAVRVPCSGRVSPELVLRAFDEGADGVLILGCHIGECHYESGNHRTAKRLPALQALLSFAGLEAERLRLDWVSASEGERFARIVNEFTEAVRALGPVRWRQGSASGRRAAGAFEWPAERDPVRNVQRSYVGSLDVDAKTTAIRKKALQLLSAGDVSCVIGYELGPRGRVRPTFVYDPQEVERLVWNEDCTHNLVRYLPEKLPARQPPKKPVAVVAKACDSRAINVLLAENKFTREQVHVIGVVCGDFTRCPDCTERTPVMYDTLIGEPAPVVGQVANLPYADAVIQDLQSRSPIERLEFWLSQFDRCIRCYACRQACPMCNCPTCLYERDDSLWVGMGIELNETRTFHLGRAYHLAGRCVGCNECERACPVGIPISLLNRLLVKEIEAAFGYRAGYAPVPTPFVTVLGGEEA